MHIKAIFTRAKRAQHFVSTLREAEIRVAIVDQDWGVTVGLATEVFTGHPVVSGRLLYLTLASLDDAIANIILLAG